MTEEDVIEELKTNIADMLHEWPVAWVVEAYRRAMELQGANVEVHFLGTKGQLLKKNRLRGENIFRASGGSSGNS